MRVKMKFILQRLTVENNECSRSLCAENQCGIYVNIEKVQRFSCCSKYHSLSKADKRVQEIYFRAGFVKTLAFMHLCLLNCLNWTRVQRRLIVPQKRPGIVRLKLLAVILLNNVR